MSSESFKKFMEKVESDQGLKQELRAAGGAAGMPLEAVVAFAAKRGFDFKVEDVSIELTDQQLDKVTGGAVNAYLIFHTSDPPDPPPPPPPPPPTK